MADRLLTAKQCAYRDARVSGLGPSDSYRHAYDVRNMSANAISVEAAHLEKHPILSLAVTSAQARVTESVVRNASDISRAAWAIIENEDAPASARVAALHLESKRFREYSEKHEVSGDIHYRIEALKIMAQIPLEDVKAMGERARRR